MFVTFEGIEGSGKTTQIKWLRRVLKERGLSCLVTREPGGTAIGKQIRTILLDQRHKKIQPKTELFLYLADRCQHVAEKIQPALNQGDWVICDRFWDATLVYQGWARGLNLKTLEKLRPLVLNSLVPDLTFLLDCPVAIGLPRAWKRIQRSAQGRRESRFEEEALTFHEKIRQGYLFLARREPQRFRLLDATHSPENIHQEIQGHLFGKDPGAHVF
ncbi:MAG TPA: dTMP kinase [Thermodesulfobacteriota bacterium]|nr:dTMP kinase [Thermodesulfobacteriota bacterium]